MRSSWALIAKIETRPARSAAIRWDGRLEIEARGAWRSPGRSSGSSRSSSSGERLLASGEARRRYPGADKPP
jgi:hypothetical protein